MTMFRRRAVLGATAGLALTRGAATQESARPLRMILPVSVGGLTDAVGRILADGMSGALGRPVVPENIVGAGSTLGALALLRSPPDGNTLLTATNNHPVMRELYPNFPHDPITAFAPIALAARQNFILAVHTDVPATDIPSLITWLRAQREKVNYGAGTPGTTNFMAGELLKESLGLEFTIVPYRASAAAVQDLVAGRLHMMIETPTMLRPLVDTGRVRALAISSPGRSEAFPDLPSLQEVGVAGYDVTAWQIIFAHADVPPATLASLEATARRVLTDPVIQERLKRIGVDTWPDPSAAAAAAHLRSETARWMPLAGRIRTN
ncbi:Bug family tripartite tricarboxylate transporter substrate binding protein [Falsiroseomonas sp. E2-1-a20]|uniref:Bug family tripartite tricarboxylate transporter substrate binding protein n=1 Tax=Falsiroseomonas sp. E2-1-a20 TaxID=3239300 RepID=UPI003F3BF9A9